MARNLQAKLPPSDTIRVFDINKPAADKLVQEMVTQQAGGAAPQVAQSAADAAKDAVCGDSLSFSLVASIHLAFMMSLFLNDCSKLGQLAWSSS